MRSFLSAHKSIGVNVSLSQQYLVDDYIDPQRKPEATLAFIQEPPDK
jgi:hypothetical protein